MSEQKLREALEAIQGVPVSSNSDPDRMAEALDYIYAVAAAALDGYPLPPPMPEPVDEDNPPLDTE